MAALTAAERDALPDTDFIFEDTRDYPYDTLGRARDALSRGAANATPAQLSTIKSKVKARYPSIKVKKTIRKAQAEMPVDIRVPIWKDDEKQLVYGVVLVPDQVDSQGDVISKEEIEKAAHSFLVRSRQHDVQHSDRPAQVETVESYVAPCDMTLAGQQVVKGSWVAVVHVKDSGIWRKVRKRELDCFSIGGSGDRTPIVA